MRGQLAADLVQKMADRIIPARAGPTELTEAMQRPSSDHPRSCGANHRIMCYRIVDAGSSPLVRGQLYHVM